VWPAAAASVAIHVLVLGGFWGLELPEEASTQAEADGRLHAVEMVEFELEPPKPESEPEPLPPPPVVEVEPVPTPARPKPAAAQPKLDEQAATPHDDATPVAADTPPAEPSGGGALVEAGPSDGGPTVAAGGENTDGALGPGSTAGDPGPAQPRGLSRDELRAYATGCRGRFMRQRRYPPAALRLRLEGTVKVKVEIDRAGHIVGAPSVAKGSGHEVLDNEALRAVRASAPFPPLPAHAKKKSIVLVIPIDFKLQR